MKRARYKRRIMYWVQNNHGLWWSSELKKWILLEGMEGFGASNNRRFFRKRKAFAHALNMGPGFSITQLIPTNQGWRTQTWTCHRDE